MPDVSRAVEPLKVLYDADVCRRLVRTSSSKLIVPLFLGGGFIAEFDEFLQLGNDLADCPGWVSQTKLVADLRAAKAFEGARFEVGVWAGLNRVGLTPEVEPAKLRSEKRPDFVVSVDGLRVAIELKGLADPDRERNLSALRWSISHCLVEQFHGQWDYDFTVFLSEAAQDQLEEQFERFVVERVPKLQGEFAEHQHLLKPNTTVALPSLGHVVVAYRSWAEAPSYAGSLDIVPDELDIPALMSRALSKVKHASKQLGSVDADLRVVVVWGSKDLLPASWAAENATGAFRDALAWNLPVDWVVFYNAHTKGTTSDLTIEMGTAALANARGPIPAQLMRALREWGVRRRARSRP